MDRRRLLWLALPFLLAAEECGPTPQEAGTAALLSILPVLLAEALALWGLTALWKRLRPDLGLRVPWLAWGAILGAHVLAFLFTVPAGAVEGAWTYAGLALYIVGSTHAALLLVAWRIALALRPGRAAVTGPVVASVLVHGPALVMVMGALTPSASDVVIDYWSYVGAGGWTPAVLLALAAGEVGVRLWRTRRVRDAAAPTASAGPPT